MSEESGCHGLAAGTGVVMAGWNEVNETERHLQSPVH